MSTVPTQIRIDENIKQSVAKLFKDLGLDMSSAVNLFLYQCVLHQGLPFSIEMPRYNKETMEAMEEAKKLSKDPSVKKYSSLKEALNDLDDE